MAILMLLVEGTFNIKVFCSHARTLCRLILEPECKTAHSTKRRKIGISDTEDLHQLCQEVIAKYGESDEVSVSVFPISAEKVLLVFQYPNLDHDVHMQYFAENLIKNYVLKLNNNAVIPTTTVAEMVEGKCEFLKQLNDEQLSFKKHYWKMQFQDECLISPFHPDYNKQKVGNVIKKIERFGINDNVRDRVYTLCKHFKVSSCTVFASIWVILLCRYSDTDDICFMLDNAGNPNDLCLKLKIDNETSFESLIILVQNKMKIAHENYIPLDQLGMEGFNKNKINVSKFQYSKETTEHVNQLSRLNITKLEINGQANSTNVSLKLTETSTGFTGELEYDWCLFKQSTAARICEHYLILLQSAISDSSGSVSRLPILTPAEISLFKHVNDSKFIPGADICVHERFEQIVMTCSSKIAIVDNDKRITYKELNARANVLANYLKRYNLEPEMIVAVCMHKSIDLVVSLLAVLKTGAAYLALDPQLPTKRMQNLIRNSQSKVILIQRFAKDYFLDSDIPLVSIESIESKENENLRLPVKPTNLAYLIYTSGTTGAPKGIMSEHRNVIAFIKAVHSVYSWRDEGVLLSASITFCIFHTLLMATLCTGNKGILASNVLEIAQLKAKEEITFIGAPPSSLQPLTEDNAMPKSVRTIALGAEKVFVQHVKSLYQSMSHADKRIFASHGTTETTSIDTTEYVNPQVEDDAKFGIGKPFPGVKAYILDSNMQKTPTGVVGELCICGPQVTRGYFKDAVKQNDKFRTNPFTNEIIPEHRNVCDVLYMSGDQCRWLENGCIDIIGRSDFQVKIRGIRMELEEISSTMLKHSSVKEAVVVVEINEHHTESLVAYFALQNQMNTTVSEIRDYLQLHLPSYMLPDRYVVLDSLPRNLNGKIDRSSLTKLNCNPIPSSSAIPTIPENELQQQVLDLARQILKNKTVELDDNLKERGMNSIHANYFAVKLEQLFSIHVQVQTLFENCTVREISSRVDEMLRGLEIVDSFDPYKETELNDVEIPILKNRVNPNLTCMKHVLLIGSTGFLGAFLLDELLHQTNAIAHCLVRAKTKSRGLERIKQNMKYYKLWNHHHQSRIECVIGDYTKPKMSLADRKYIELAKMIEAVYHSGGNVNFDLPYSELRSHAVDGMKEVVHFACQTRIKTLVHISSVAVHAFSGNIIDEIADITEYKHGNMGYVRMKWVSETIAWKASQRGLPIVVFRPSFIGGHSQTGAMSTNEFVAKFIKGCIQMKCFPVGDIAFNIIPVDFVAKAVVCLSLESNSINKAYHLTASKECMLNVQDLMSWVEEWKVKFDAIESGLWLELLHKCISENKTNELAPLLKFATDYMQQKQMIYGNRETMSALATKNITCPLMSKEYVTNILNFFCENEFLSNT